MLSMRCTRAVITWLFFQFQPPLESQMLLFNSSVNGVMTLYPNSSARFIAALTTSVSDLCYIVLKLGVSFLTIFIEPTSTCNYSVCGVRTPFGGRYHLVIHSLGDFPKNSVNACRNSLQRCARENSIAPWGLHPLSARDISNIGTVCWGRPEIVF